MSGRKRSSAGGATKAQIAAAINARRNARFPYSKYGAAHFLRGSEGSLSQFGSSFKSATPAQRTFRRSTGFVGRGMYQSNRGAYAGRALGGMLGGMTKIPGLSQAGAHLGSMAEDKIMSLIKGRGAYTNSLITMGGPTEGVPSFQSAGDETGALRITHREYVTDIYGNPLVSGSTTMSTPFELQAFSLNPGLEKTFPWLSQIAANYEEYEMGQLIFTFRSTTSDIGSSSNGQVGTVVMCTNYNAAAPVFTEKKTMMEYDAASSCKTTEPMMHGIECDPRKKSGSEGKYVRTNPVLVNEDLKSYDHGTFQLAISGSPAGFANQSIGELWVSYTVILRKPKFYTTLGLSISRDVFVSGGGETSALPMGTQALLLSGQQNNIGCSLTLSTNNILVTFPAGYSGNLVLKYFSEGPSATIPQVAFGSGFTTTGNIVYLRDMYASGGDYVDGPNYFFVSNGTNQVTVELHFSVSIATNAINNSINIPFTGATAVPSQSALEVFEYNTYQRPAGIATFISGTSGPKQSNISAAPVLIDISGAVKIPV